MVHESLRKMTEHTLQDRLALVTKVFGVRCREAGIFCFDSIQGPAEHRPT